MEDTCLSQAILMFVCRWLDGCRIENGNGYCLLLEQMCAFVHHNDHMSALTISSYPVRQLLGVT